MASRSTESLTLDVAGRSVVVTHPWKPAFPEAGHTRLDLVQYYLAVALAALRGVQGRPMALKRDPDGAAGLAWLATQGCLDLNPHAVRADELAHSLEPLLEWVRRDEAAGLGDAPWPPHDRKQAGEPARVQPSRARKARAPR